MLRLICCVLIGLVSTEVIAQADAADQVWLAPSKRTETASRWYPQPVTVISGTIVSLDNKQLAILVTGDEVPRRIAGDRVLWIRPGSVSEKETAALELFADGDYAGALRPLIDSLAERPPVWRQQWLSMLAAYAAKRSSRGQIALELVSQLDTRPLAPYVLAWLPIAWENQQQPAASIEAAAQRLADPSPAVRLVAASWLLSSPNRSPAAAELKRISVDANRPVLARLAESLMWRTATPPQVAEQADSWQEKTEQLPMVLQTGPLLLLRDKFEAAGLEREAEQLKLSLELTPVIPYPIK